MNAAGINVDGRPVEEAWLRAKCRDCGSVQDLASLAVRENGQQTEYICANDCPTPVVIVGPAPALQGGYRLKENVVLPTAGMWFKKPGG